jgi:hypothetical protein
METVNEKLIRIKTRSFSDGVIYFSFILCLINGLPHKKKRSCNSFSGS